MTHTGTRRPRSRGLTAALACAALLTAGCGYGNTATTSTSQNSSSNSITMWIQSADPFVAAHKKLIADFQAANPGVRVNLQTFPFADFNTRVVTSMANGSGPDLMEAYAPWMTGYIRTGLVAPVPAAVDTTAQIQSRFFSSALSSLQFKGAYYGLPSNLAAGSTRVLLIDQTALSKAGIDPAKNRTFQDWISSWQKLTVKDASGKITHEGLGQSCGQPADQFVSYLMEYGGSLLSQDGHTAALNSDAGFKALSLVRDLSRKYNVDSPQITDGTCIPQGSAATGYRGTWVLPDYQRDYPTFKFSYQVMPLPPGATHNIWQGGSGWASYVPKASKNRDLAFKFMQFEDEHRQTWIDNTSEIPAIKSLAQQLATAKPAVYGAYGSVLDQARNAYAYGDYFIEYQTLSDMATSVTLKDTDPKVALATAEAALNSHLKHWWSQYP